MNPVRHQTATPVAHVGDQVLIVPQGPAPARDGTVIEVREGATGPVYLVEWSDDLVRSVLISGSQVRVRHLFGCGQAGCSPTPAS